MNSLKRSVAFLSAILMASYAFATPGAKPARRSLNEVIESCEDTNCKYAAIWEISTLAQVMSQEEQLKVAQEIQSVSSQGLSAEGLIQYGLESDYISESQAEFMAQEHSNVNSYEAFQSKAAQLEEIGGQAAAYNPKLKRGLLFGVGFTATIVFAFLVTFSGPGYLIPFFASGIGTGVLVKKSK
jgi:hypothetical protein